MSKPFEPPEPTNPWGLTVKQLQTVEQLARLGHCKLVAHEMKLSIGTVYERLEAALRRMKAKHTILACIEFDRWRTGCAPTTSTPSTTPESKQ